MDTISKLIESIVNTYAEKTHRIPQQFSTHAPTRKVEVQLWMKTIYALHHLSYGQVLTIRGEKQTQSLGPLIDTIPKISQRRTLHLTSMAIQNTETEDAC